MQHERFDTRLAAWTIVPLLLACACSSSPMQMSYGQDPSADGDPSSFEFFSNNPRSYDAALRALQRIETAIGPSGLVLAEPGVAASCVPFRAGCGFELSFSPLVYCLGNPNPALACTSMAGGGKALGIQMQADLAGDELDNRLIHELFHVITRDQAPHSADGLFMAYSVGDERITTSTLETVCNHFPCATFVVEQQQSVPALVRP